MKHFFNLNLSYKIKINVKIIMKYYKNIFHKRINYNNNNNNNKIKKLKRIPSFL